MPKFGIEKLEALIPKAKWKIEFEIGNTNMIT